MKLFRLKSPSLSDMFSRRWSPGGSSARTVCIGDVPAEISPRSVSDHSTPPVSYEEPAEITAHDDSHKQSTTISTNDHKVSKTWSRRRLCRLRKSMTPSVYRRSRDMPAREDLTPEQQVEKGQRTEVTRTRSFKSLFDRHSLKNCKPSQESFVNETTVSEKSTTGESTADSSTNTEASEIRKFPYAFIKSNRNRRKEQHDADSGASTSVSSSSTTVAKDLLLPAPLEFRDQVDEDEQRSDSAQKCDRSAEKVRTIASAREKGDSGNSLSAESGNDSIDSDIGVFFEVMRGCGMSRHPPIASDKSETANKFDSSTNSTRSGCQRSVNTSANNMCDSIDSGCEAEVEVDVSRLIITSSPILRSKKRHHGKRVNHFTASSETPRATTAYQHSSSHETETSTCSGDQLLVYQSQPPLHITSKIPGHYSSSQRDRLQTPPGAAYYQTGLAADESAVMFSVVLSCQNSTVSPVVNRSVYGSARETGVVRELGISIVSGSGHQHCLAPGSGAGLFIGRMFGAGATANRSLMKEGDEILAVNGELVGGLPYKQAIGCIRQHVKSKAVELMLVRGQHSSAASARPRAPRTGGTVPMAAATCTDL